MLRFLVVHFLRYPSWSWEARYFWHALLGPHGKVAWSFNGRKYFKFGAHHDWHDGPLYALHLGLVSVELS